MQTSPSSSPPDFDFNLPCRYFKSSFARSLSMHQGSGGAGFGADAEDDNDMQHCKSLDFDIGQFRKIIAFHNNSCNNNASSNISIDTIDLECPPLPQRRQATNASTNAKNEAVNNNGNHNNSNNVADFEREPTDNAVEEDAKPPAIPARCPIVAKSKSAGALNMQLRQQQQQQQTYQQQQQLLAQFRHAAIAENANAGGNAAVGVGTTTAAATHGNFNRPINHSKQQKQQQQQQHQHQKQEHSHASGNVNNNNHNNSSDALSGSRVGRSRCSLSNRRNVWPTDREALHQQQQPQQQQCDNLLFDVEDDASVENDVDNVATAAPPPVAATRSTLTPHYAPAKPKASTTPTAVVRATPPANCIEQHMPTFKAHHSDNAATTATVQVVLLQNQVDTLQWQLKQVETSNEMYRAVIEEIARFLDRYQTQKQLQRQLQQQQQISRSKSLYQVYDGNSNCEGHEQNTSGNSTFSDKSTATSSCLRTRSSSNLIVDLKQSAMPTGNVKSHSANGEHSTLATTAADKRSYDAINTSANNSYTAFKDFTWRRSPKKCAESKAQAAANDVEEKLNQEAFRLSRTIHNLLNTSTRQPDLTQHRSSLTTRSNGVQSKVLKAPAPPPTPAIPKLISPAAQSNASSKKHIATNATSKSNSRAHPAANSLANATAEMLFLRANNIRDSRLSLRSSTDSSVHSTTSNSSAVSSSSSSSAASTSSCKVETDEDITLHQPFHGMALPFKQLQHPLGSATEDESGFSSISSFQDIGVPLCSTMISNGTSTPNRLSLASVKFDTVSLGNANGGVAAGLCGDTEVGECAGDSRNSTLKANHPSNVLGVPLQATHDMQHRWDTTTTTKTSYRSANKYQRFSTLSKEDASAVLWV